MNFTEQLKLKKPTASAGTIKTYNSLLRSVYKKAFGDTDSPDIENFKNVENIMDSLKDDLLQTKKTKLSAILVFAPLPEYRTTILRLAKENNEINEASVMTPKLQASEITLKEITTIMARLKQNADFLFKMASHTMPQLQQIQDYVILSLYYGHIAPRRAKDYIEMVLTKGNSSFPLEPIQNGVPRGVPSSKQNYFDLRKSKFIFNDYKTAAIYDTQTIDIPPALKKILVKWIKIIPAGAQTLLFNAATEPLTGVSLNQRLNNIFGAMKSVNSLRHLFLTENHAETIISQDKLATDMVAMGSSIKQAKNYIKVNPLPAPE